MTRPDGTTQGHPPAIAANRVNTTFQRLRADNRRGLIPFIVASHPHPDATSDLILAIDRAGADVIEIGIPFSDPIADGPVIAQAMHNALEAGATLERTLDAVANARAATDAAIVAMTSISIVQRNGIDTFMRRAANAGFDGVIVPDAPLDEAAPITTAATQHALTATLLIAPSTSPERTAQITSTCTGFVYLLARAGVTGERAGQPAPSVAARVQHVREHTDLPIACGFGIATPEDAHQVTRHADAAIVGSALVRRLTDAEDPAAEASSFVASLRAAIDA